MVYWVFVNSSNISILYFIKIIENFFNKITILNIVKKGTPYEEIDISVIKPILKILNIEFDEEQYYIDAIRKNF